MTFHCISYCVRHGLALCATSTVPSCPGVRCRQLDRESRGCPWALACQPGPRDRERHGDPTEQKQKLGEGLHWGWNMLAFLTCSNTVLTRSIQLKGFFYPRQTLPWMPWGLYEVETKASRSVLWHCGASLVYTCTSLYCFAPSHPFCLV